MQQPIEILSEDTAPAEGPVPRRLRVVTESGSAQRLVTYVVLAPTHLSPEDLFAPQVVVRPTAPLRLEEVETPAAPHDPVDSGTDTGTETARDRAAERAGSGIRIDSARRIARVDGEPLELTYLEFEVLAHFVAHPHLVHSRTRLLELVWGYAYAGDGRTVDVHIARLRRKLGPAHRGTIRTVRRAGYKYVPADQAAGPDV